MKKVKIHTWHTLETQKGIFLYFYIHTGYNRDNVPKFKIFLLDEDSRVYEFTLIAFESYLDDDLTEIIYEGKF